MRVLSFLSLVVFMLLQVRCSGAGKLPVDEYFTRSDTLVNQGKFNEAIEMLGGVETYYPADTGAVIRSLNAMADIYAMNMNNYDQSVSLMQKIIDRYPDSPESPKCLFKIGFTCENMIKDIPRAKKSYEEFLAKYPNHELALSVKVSLEHLGESDEELLERLIKKNENLRDTIQ